MLEYQTVIDFAEETGLNQSFFLPPLPSTIIYLIFVEKIRAIVIQSRVAFVSFCKIDNRSLWRTNILQ